MPNMFNAVCKACGGETPVDLDNVRGVTRCEYCDTVITLPKSDCSPETIDLLRRGETLLYTCDFDKAYNIFKRVTVKAPEEPEAYFGMALAAFRVQYLFDRVNRREQPICYDISEQLFSADDNCKKAIALALGAQKAEYLRRAAEIDSIRRKFYLLKNSGEKYDCFICVKVSDETGRMTDDAATAMRLHRELEKRGYKPFYSEFDIHDRVGADYESLILYALYTAKCMIVVCGKEQYLRTEWVQNEYTRFLRMIGRKDKAADALAIAYSGAVIERLPGSEKKYQGVDLKKPDAFSLLNDFVARHVSPEKPTKKYCSACGTENSATAKFCNNCGKTEFLESYEQYIQIKTERELREKLEAEYKAKYEAERKDMAQEQSSDDAEAEAWYRQALEFYKQKKYTEAAKLFRQAAEKDHVQAQNSLGLCYDRGHGVPQDCSEAVRWFKKAAEKGTPWAIHNVGHMYYSGRGVAVDYSEAVRWFRQAADMGHAQAQHGLGVCYENGRGVPKDYAEAVRWYRMAAEQDYANAQCNLGLCYENGWGVPKDYTEAVRLYRQAAEKGLATALFNLGVCYENGRGVPRDYTEAVSWYRKAAEKGHARAQNNLGVCYENGRGVPKDYAETVNWYRKAAENGYAMAQSNLGLCYENGRGVAKDINEAIKWYRKAAEQGYANAKTALERLENQAVQTVWAPPSSNGSSDFVIVGTELKKYKGEEGSVKIPYGIKSIGENAFRWSSGLTCVEIPDSVTDIREGAFYGCESLTDIEIPVSVTSIGKSAFEDCYSLTGITVKSGNKKYHSSGNCLIDTQNKILIVGCKNSVIPADGSVVKIGERAFSGCEIKSLNIPKPVTSIESGAFASCDIASITIPDSVISIGARAFEGSHSLTDVVLPDSVRSIGEYAFSDSELKSITIPSSVTSIEGGAFSYCYGLTTIRYGGTKAQWEKIKKGQDWDEGVSPDFKVLFQSGSAQDSYDNSEFEIEGTELKSYKGKAVSVKIPHGVTGIGEWAFQDCGGIKTIEIPSTVTYIGSAAFWGCSAETIMYNGTKEQWNKIKKEEDWFECANMSFKVVCKDGTEIKP